MTPLTHEIYRYLATEAGNRPAPLPLATLLADAATAPWLFEERTTPEEIEAAVSELVRLGRVRWRGDEIEAVSEAEWPQVAERGRLFA